MKYWITGLAMVFALGAIASLGKNVVAASNGATVYTTNCSSCHGAAGKGVAGAFPPLAGNPHVTGAAKSVIHTVKYGLTGSITVAGSPYNGTMPPWGAQLSNDDIAAVITYIRSSWGNKASAVKSADVAKVTK